MWMWNSCLRVLWTLESEGGNFFEGGECNSRWFLGLGKLISLTTWSSCSSSLAKLGWFHLVIEYVIYDFMWINTHKFSQIIIIIIIICLSNWCMINVFEWITDTWDMGVAIMLLCKPSRARQSPQKKKDEKGGWNSTCHTQKGAKPSAYAPPSSSAPNRWWRERERERRGEGERK